MLPSAAHKALQRWALVPSGTLASKSGRKVPEQPMVADPPSIKLSPDPKNDQLVNLSIDILQRDMLPDDGTKYDVMAAITEDNLTNNVSRGENAGRKLTHDAVVRSLRSVREFKASDPSKPFRAALQIDPSWKRRDLHVVVYLQSKTDLRIRGAATARLPEAMLHAAGGAGAGAE